MARVGRFLKALFEVERGQALVEYGLILALITLVAIVGMSALAGGVGGMYDVVLTIVEAMANALAG